MKKTGLFRHNDFSPKNLGFVFLVLLAILIGIFSSPGCAVIIPPSGGPKDTLPPVLVSALPKDSMLHFTAKKIVLTFDEYVKLDNNLGDNLIVSPNPVTLPVVESSLRTVTIVIKDTLKPNTTYSINFGKALKDVNEGNIAKNFTYIFSTGSKLDRGKIAGKVLLAETGQVDSTLLVVLQNNLSDTAIKKNNPVYYTRVDNKGNFVFRNLAPATYNVFVLPSEYSKKYDDSTKMFAFLNSPVLVTDSSSTPPVTLYAYHQFKPSPKKKTNNNAAASTNKKKPKKEVEKANLKMGVSGKEGPQDLLKPFSFTFTAKIDSFDTSKIILADTNFHQLKGYSFSEDTSLTQFYLNYNWLEDVFYKVIVEKDAFKDSLGATIAKSDTITFKTMSEGDYGSIRLHFNGLDLSKNPVILLFQNEKIVKTVPLKSNEWYQQLFNPGDYELRILYDDNKNGVWDPGDYSLKKQPEIVTLIPRKLHIKANIDNDVDINL